MRRVLSRISLPQRRALTRFCSGPATDLLTLNEEQTALVDTVRKIGQDVIAPRVLQMDETMSMHKEVFDALFSAGLMGIEIDDQYGGSGMTFYDSILVIEELAKVDPSVSVMCDVQNTLVINLFRRFANANLQQEWFPRLAKDTVGSFCLSEAGSGSDAFALACKAQKDGNDYVLTGSKMWITNAHEAGVYLVMANVDHSKGYKGITCFVVPRDAPGLTIGKKENKLGIRASSTCEVRLDGVRVPADAILGEIGQGYKIAIGTLNEGRIGIASQMLGVAQGAFDVAVRYTKERNQFGSPICNFQGMQFQIADCYKDILSARLLTYNAARRMMNGLPFVQDAAVAKLSASEVAAKVSSLAVEWMGGQGFIKDSKVEKFYRDAKIGAIYEGTSNIQRQTIAKNVVAGL